MSKQSEKRDTGCPIAFSLDVFGDKWSLLIVRDLLLVGHKTYGQCLGSKERISTNILADRMKRLEAEGIINKSSDPNNRKSYIYSLTKKGLDLAPIVLEAIKWGGAHDPNTIAPDSILDRIENDRDNFLTEIRSYHTPKE